MSEDLHSHELTELTPLNGIRRRLHEGAWIVFHGDGDCRVEVISREEGERLLREEKKEEPSC